MMTEKTLTDVDYVEMHGQRVAYRHAGRGEVVLLLHGMAGSSDTWQEIIPLLAQRYRVIAPDLLGHGRSDKPRTDYSLGAFAAGLRDLLDELGIERVTVVGHSLGGGVAMQFLYQHPEYCHRLVLISSGGLGTDVGWILRLLSAPGAEFVLPFIAPNMVLAIGNRVRSWLSRTPWGSPSAEQAWQAYSSLSDPPTRSAFLRTPRSVVDFRGQSVSALSRLRAYEHTPTLVIWGDHDPIIPVQHGHAVQAARPHSTLTVLPGVGHFPHVEAPNDVAANIDDFITRSAAATGTPIADSLTTSPNTRQPGNDRLPPTDCGMGEDLSGVLVEQATLIDGLVEDLDTRTQVEIAVGLLMGLRHCSQSEAAHEFTRAVDETHLEAANLARALVAMVDGEETSEPETPAAHRHQVQRWWGPLLAARGMNDDDPDTASIPAKLKVRYAPENESMIC